jgi:putative peptidoglycan lipid II flippase
MIRGILTVGGWTLLSRVLGFARDMLIAALLGVGPIADAFFVALKLPNLFRRLFGEGAFNAAFVPAFSGLLAAEGHEAARRFAAEAFAVMIFWLGLLTIAGEVFMPQVMTVLAPGFGATPAKFALAVELSRITFPYLILICLAALVSGMLNGLDRFTAASASYVLFNIVTIAAMIWLAPYVPTVGHALAWGVTASGVAQLGVLLVAVRRAGMALRVPWPRLTPQMRLLMRRMAPGLVGAGVTQLNLAIDVIIASLLPAGTVSILYYADRVQQLPLGVIGTAVGTALLPMLSRQVRAGEADAASGTLNRALEYALFLTLPAAFALIVSAWPVMFALFDRGAFGADSTLLSSQALAAYAIGLPAFVLVKVLAPGFFARGDTATPVKIGVAAVALNLALNLAFMGPLRHVGPALATSLAAMFNAGCLGAVLARRGQLRLDAKIKTRVPRMLVAALVMAAALAGAQHALFGLAMPHGVLRLAALAGLIAVGLVAYGAAGQMFGAYDLRELPRTLRRRAARPAVLPGAPETAITRPPVS